MAEWGHICRVCSSPADYEIFAKIPTYLHGSMNEFLNWQKPINLLLEETTGLKNSKNDGLPSFICAPCISYLKHAVTFREQCIQNAVSLKLAHFYQQKPMNIDENTNDKVDKENVLYTADDLQYVEQRPMHNMLLNNRLQQESADKVHKQLLNQSAPQEGTYEQRIRFLNVLFDKDQLANSRSRKSKVPAAVVDLPTTSAGSGHGSGNGTADDDDFEAITSSDEPEANELISKHKNCYNYSETNFEDDDPIEDMRLHSRDIKVNIPEPTWKERKCPACFKRFMFEDSYNTHIENCVEHQFVVFVHELTKLLEIRRQKMVSPHEFIRRTIFALHKTCTWLQEHSIDSLLAEKLNQVKIASNGVNEKTTERMETVNVSSGAATPITYENNILYAIERSESRNSQPATTPVSLQKPIPIRGNAAAPIFLESPTQAQQQHPIKLEDARTSFLEKLFAAKSPTKSTTMLTFSARCSQCNLIFDSVTELEAHNVSHHNGQRVKTNMPTASQEEDSTTGRDDVQRRQIIALFEDDI